jgi:hypothetical protein
VCVCEDALLRACCLIERVAKAEEGRAVLAWDCVAEDSSLLECGLRHVGCVVPDVSKGRGAFIFKGYAVEAPCRRRHDDLSKRRESLIIQRHDTSKKTRIVRKSGLSVLRLLPVLGLLN